MDESVSTTVATTGGNGRAVWFYGEHGTGRMTGARYLHQQGRSLPRPFVRYELPPENTGQLETLLTTRRKESTLVLSHRISDTRTAAPSWRVYKARSIGLFVWWALAALRWWSRRQLTDCGRALLFAMTQIACQSLFSATG